MESISELELKILYDMIDRLKVGLLVGEEYKTEIMPNVSLNIAAGFNCVEAIKNPFSSCVKIHIDLGNVDEIAILCETLGKVGNELRKTIRELKIVKSNDENSWR